MKPRSEQCCGNCDAGKDAGDGSNILCRFLPPVPVFYGMMPHPIQVGPNSMQPIVMSHFPALDAKNGWCRQWSPRTEGEA
jgi:hypothetical protein